jgi:hypothetical protein
MEGEVRTTFWSNGRRITMDDFIRKGSQPIEIREVETSLPAGIQMNWVEGDNGELHFSLNTGAGVGSRWMTFHYRDRDFAIEAQDIVRAFITFAEEES